MQESICPCLLLLPLIAPLREKCSFVPNFLTPSER